MLASADPAGFAEMLADSELVDARLELDADGDTLGSDQAPGGDPTSDADPIDVPKEAILGILLAEILAAAWLAHRGVKP